MKTLKQLWLAVSLIVAASLLLLISDLGQRVGKEKSAAQPYHQIAIMQITSTTVLDSHVAGVLDRLETEGMIAPDRRNLHLYNPQGDYATANTIARDIVNSQADIIITSSTLALQVVSKANVNTQKYHVFGAVTDPYGTGVGITGKNPEDHPPYLAGIGTFQPVARAFILAREMNPGLKRVGVAWNAGEQCSEACMIKARAICKDLGIELIEAVVGNTSEVSEAARSLIAKGAEAIWIGGDTVASASVKLLVNLANQAGIPVFSNDPNDAAHGALFGVGGNYFTVGQLTADVAIAVLRGKSPAEFRIENMVPELLKVNDEVLASLEKWHLTPDIKKTLEEQEKAADNSFNSGKVRGAPAKVAIVNLVENKPLNDAIQGVEDALRHSGFVSGMDVIIKKYSAQGDIAQLPQVLDAAAAGRPEAIVTVTTPVQAAAVKRIKDIPVVFTVASDPFKQGLFTEENRPGNVCGVHDDPPVEEVLKMARNYVPGLKKVGTIYDAAQVNSIFSVEKLRQAVKAYDIELLEVTASTVPDLTLATRALVQRGAQALIFSADNLVYTGFNVITGIADAAGVPTFTTEPDLVEQHATGAYGDSFYDWGVQSGKMLAKVLAGVPPHNLPIEKTKVQRRIEPNARNKSFSHPPQPWKLRIVLYSETEFAERCLEGLVDGIQKAGLVENKDYELKTYNAQGDMSTLSSIMTAVKSDQVDLLMPISTPALQAALRMAGTETKIVFTGVGDGVKAGAGKSETDHLPNVTGISTRSPFDGMARVIKETLPQTRNVGTLFTPAEINSVLYKDWFKEALEKQGIQLVAVPVTSSADVAQAAGDLCGKDIQVVAQVVDNLTRPGFALIARKAQENSLPVYVFDSGQMNDGGVICIARDYYDAGLEAAEKAVQVLRGESPANIPFNNTRSEKFLINYALVEKYQIRLPDYLKAKATAFTVQKGEK